MLKGGLWILVVMGLFTGVVFAQEPIVQPFGYLRADGNRVADGTSTFPDVTEQILQFNTLPTLLAALPYNTPEWWRGILTGDAFPIGNDLSVMMVLMGQDAPFSYPVLIDSQWLVWVFPNGDVSLFDASTEQFNIPTSNLVLSALPDARPVVNANGQIAVYVDATDERYVHGIMGDDLEAASLAILEVVDGQLQVVSKIELSGDNVFEGLSPIWADVDEDGSEDLIVTVSNSQVGAGVKVYRTDGSLLAEADPVGQPFRWRHQLAWGAFGENGERGLIEVLTPHIGGQVGFYTLEGNRLVKQAGVGGYTSHVIGTRNLDMAVAGDFNGDGQLEIVLPDQGRGRLAGLQISGESFAEVWTLPLNGLLSTNLAAIGLPDGQLGLAAGTDAGTVHVWLPL